MDTASSTPETRAGALAMIADGNSVESVASVFGVSADAVRQWMREPVAAQAEVVHPAAAAHPPRGVASVVGSDGRLEWLARFTFVAALTAVVLWFFVPVIADDFHGSPPIDQLHRTEGWVKTWRACYALPRNVTQEDVTLVGAHSTVTWSLPCVLPPGALADGQVHRMTVLSGWRRRIGTVVYEVTLDGRTLLAYVRQPPGPPWADLGFLAFLMAFLLPTLVGVLWTFPRRPRQS